MKLDTLPRYLFTYGLSFFLSISFVSLSILLVNRSFGLETVGLWTLYISSIELFRSLDLGVSQLLARTTARLNLRSSRTKVLANILSYSLLPLILYLLIAGNLFYVFYSLPLGNLFQPFLLTCYFLAALIANLALNFIYNILLGLRLQALWKSLQSIHLFLRLVLLGFFPLFSTIHSLIASVAVVDVLFSLFTITYFCIQYSSSISELTGKIRPKLLCKSALCTKNTLLNYALFAFLMTLVGRASSQLDSLFVINMLGTDSAALLEISTKIGLSFGMVTSLISHWMFPRTTKRNNISVKSSSSKNFVRLISSISFLLSLILSAFYASINHAFGKDAIVAALCCSILLLINVTLCIESLVVAHSSSHGPKRIFYIDSLSLLVNLPLTFFLISKFGWVGAPIATGFSVTFISAPLLSIYFHQLITIHNRNRWSQALYSFIMHKTIPLQLIVAVMIFIDAAAINYLLSASITIELLYMMPAVVHVLRYYLYKQNLISS